MRYFDLMILLFSAMLAAETDRRDDLTKETVMVKLYAQKSLTVSRAPPAIVGNTAIVGGSVVRTEAGNIEVDFGYTFKSPPHVVVSSHLEGLGPVGYAETIIHIGTSTFIVGSFNAQENYSVEWIAIGEKI